MQRKQKPVIRIVAVKHEGPTQPSLQSDGREKRDWADTDAVWTPFTLTQSRWGEYSCK